MATMTATKTTVTVVIKRDADRNYERLFAAADQAAGRRWVLSLAERETEDGYAVDFWAPPERFLEWVRSRPKDFAVVAD